MKKEKKKGNKKRTLIIIICIVLVFVVLALNTHNFVFGINPFDRSTVVITTEPGEVIEYGTTFVRYNKISSGFSKKGNIERLEYTTDVYEDGVTYSKYCNVYLPYGYDPNRSEPYNVVYFQHGHTMDPEIFATYPMSRYMNNLFAADEIEPCILVFTTYYMDPAGDSKERLKSGNVPAGDGNWDGLPANFWMEVTEDIMPLVESRYNTYAKNDVSPEGLMATREHRAFTGYSRGGVCTWYMFHHALEYFKWFSPMSCHCMAEQKLSHNVDHEAAFQYLEETIDAHPDLDFFIYVQSGGPKDAETLREQMKYFVAQTDTFSYGSDPTVNNLYYSVSDFIHSDRYVPWYYYNSLPLFFGE